MSTYSRMMNKIKKEQDEIDKYSKLSYEEKLDLFMKQYGMSIDSETLKFIIRTEFSDIIFEQHQKSWIPVTILMLIMQTIITVVSTLTSAIKPEIRYAIDKISPSIMVFIILIFVLWNNYVHSKTWYNSKKRLAKIEIALDMLPVRAKTELIQELQDKYNIDVGDIIDKG